MGQVCLIPATGTRNQRFWAGRGLPRPPQSRWFVVLLTFPPVYGTFPTMISLHQTGFGMFSARVGRCCPGGDEKRFLINGDVPLTAMEQTMATRKSCTSDAVTWTKYAANPVLGGNLGTCFDVAVLQEDDTYRMWFSWRPKQSIALVESRDGIRWSEPSIVLGPNPATGWEQDINRPTVVNVAGLFHMWYSAAGQGRRALTIGYATSPDGRTWKRMCDQPVLLPDVAWEDVAVMCPHVVWDAPSGLFRMWYSGGDAYEPDAIGYATSADGIAWRKHPQNPIFTPDRGTPWEKAKVTACQVLRHGGWHVMFYIGFRDVQHAAIGLARSRDGIANWERHRANPILQPDANAWDADACYKPYALFDGRKWRLWYNGRRGTPEQPGGGPEQIGVAFKDGEDLGF